MNKKAYICKQCNSEGRSRKLCNRCRRFFCEQCVLGASTGYCDMRYRDGCMIERAAINGRPIRKIRAKRLKDINSETPVEVISQGVIWAQDGFNWRASGKADAWDYERLPIVTDGTMEELVNART